MLDSLKGAATTFLIGAVLVLAVMLLNSFGRVELAQSRQRTAEADLRTEKAEHARTRDAVAAQKREAEEKLRSLNASVLAAQNQFDASRATEAQTALENGRLLGALRDRLRDLRESRRLLAVAEAGGRGDGGDPQPGAARSAAAGGGRNPAEAGGLLPAASYRPADEGDADAFDADAINVAYIACRNDAIGLRRALSAP